MALTMVKMTEEVWLTCVAHSLTTESEEIMGLLLGDITSSNGGNKVALIWGALPQMRSDRRKDRVETNPELLTAAAEQADIMSRSIGKTTRVIGWYHSHPHITVLPSHVDVRTQAMYQLMEPGFIGLIFSCFNEDALKVGKIQVIAFQSGNNGEKQNVNVPASASPVTIIEGADNIMALPTPMVSETTENNNMDVDLMTPSMQEALHRSNLDVSGAEYVRKEIEFQVLPTKYVLNLESPLAPFTRLQHMLYQEERSAYNQAINHNLRDEKMHPLTYIHHTSTYHASLCKLMEYCLSPAITILQDQQKQNDIRMAMLKEEENVLEEELRKKEADPTNIKVESPRHVPPHHHQGISPRSPSTRRNPI